jgi:hypothetical protein
MTLTRGRPIGYEFDRMVMLFSMVDGQTEIPCAISTFLAREFEGTPPGIILRSIDFQN